MTLVTFMLHTHRSSWWPASMINWTTKTITRIRSTNANLGVHTVGKCWNVTCNKACLGSLPIHTSAQATHSLSKVICLSGFYHDFYHKLSLSYHCYHVITIYPGFVSSFRHVSTILLRRIGIPVIIVNQNGLDGLEEPWPGCRAGELAQ